MNNALSLAQLKFDVWLIEQLQINPDSGLTLEELKSRWAICRPITGNCK